MGGGVQGSSDGRRFIVRMTKLTSIMALLGAAACQSGESSTAPELEPTPGAPGGLYAEPPIDVASSVPTAALAFSYDGAVFRGGYLTHEVAVTDGVIDVKPWHRDP